MEHFLQRNNGYLARKEISELLEQFRNDPMRLEPYGFKVYSQGDEDGIIEEIFRRLDIKKGSFCEIGVEKGLECNTHYLLHKGWSGIWIDGRSEYIEYILENCPQVNKKLKVIHAYLTKSNLNNTLESIGLTKDRELDFLSIDIDGNDIHLFTEMDIRPKVICIEYNAKWPANVSRIPVYNPDNIWCGDDYMGASLKSLVDVAKFKAYELVGTNITGANAFFVRKDLVKDRFSLAPIEKLYNPPRYWLIYDHFWHIGHPAAFGKYDD
jgi:hypothetical protein